MKKIRLTKEMFSLDSSTDYKMTFTPIICRIDEFNFKTMEMDKAVNHLNRVVVHTAVNGMFFLKLRGKAPYGKAFTLDEFIKHFYMIKDSMNRPIFKYFK